MSIEIASVHDKVTALRDDFELLAEALYGLDWREKAQKYRKAILERQERIERGDPCQATSWSFQGVKVAVCAFKEGHKGDCIQTPVDLREVDHEAIQ